MSAPKYTIGTRIESNGMTVVGVIDRGEDGPARYLLDGIEGPVEEVELGRMLARKPAKKEEPVANEETAADSGSGN